MMSKAAGISELAFRSLVRTFWLFRSHMDPYFASYGLTPAKWGVLRALHRAESDGQTPIRLSQLGQRLLVKPSCVTSVVETLLRNGLISRKADSSDQRAKIVGLTPAGRRLVRRVLKKHPSQMNKILKPLKPAEQQSLYRLMSRIAVHLESSNSKNKARQFNKDPFHVD